MKYIYPLLAVTMLLLSCGEGKKNSLENILASDNLLQLREKRGEVDAKKLELEAQLKLIDDRILELDTIKRLPLVTTVKIEAQNFVHYLELQGNVQTKQNLVIYPEMGGILEHVYVKEGQRVTKGQLLAKLDDGGLSQQLAQLQIQTDLAKTTFDRQERLWNQKIGSEIQYLQAKSSFEAQQKLVNQVKSQLSKTNVTAPFTGIVDDVITNQGSVVAPGQTPIIRIINLDNMYIETEVPESYISNVSVNKAVIVEIPILGKTIEGIIRQASNFINPDNRTFKIEIAVPNKDGAIKPNLTARLKINDYTNPNAMLIPQSVISENAEGDQYIYLVNNKNTEDEATAQRTIISTGKTQGDVIEVLTGLSDNAEIINEGARSVQDGQLVKILR
ncbi:efflux RND transporter periplasmic adaptor subunit [Gaetbulibacter aquiaggeris]|uniref:Efflux RND transporter periplasmic adaptor subunit n=1 Tax=Gaetbulibacter aquiaggeris TaxID=1735373 RepID=A0ABW7MTE0_9FLAO